MKRIRPARFSLLAVILLTLAGFACRPSVTPPPNPGGPAGWVFEDGKRATVGDYTGRVLLLNFYATWCGPCRQEMPHLIALHRKYEAEGLQIVGLNVGGEEDYAEVPAFKQEYGIPFPLATPDTDFVDRYLGVNQNIPQSFVIDRNGRIVKHFIGFSEESVAEVETVVQAALKK
ncbi:MAG TPA: TlpA disulfide reductase family protein [Pyrinomonadaceae bacterium]|nr:TlpA disulfide reductase family protein [Pyrinomonadaceae bacterium]